MALRYPKSKNLKVHCLDFTKRELEAVPVEHRSFYLALGECNNEIVILLQLLVRAHNGVRKPRVVEETALGTLFYLARMLAGKLYETREVINAERNSMLYDKLWEIAGEEGISEIGARDEGKAGLKAFNEIVGKTSKFNTIRNKVGFHTNQSLLDAGFELMPSDVKLADFHTGSRGRTFFGAADTVMAFTVSKIYGRSDVISGASELMTNVTSAVGAVGDFIDSYLIAFAYVFFGPERLREMREVMVENAPLLTDLRLDFWVRTANHKDISAT